MDRNEQPGSPDAAPDYVENIPQDAIRGEVTLYKDSSGAVRIFLGNVNNSTGLSSLIGKRVSFIVIPEKTVIPIVELSPGDVSGKSR